MRPFSRADRVGSLIRDVLAEALRKKAKDPRLNAVVISTVKLSSDLKNAKIYFVVTGSKDGDRIEQAKKGLENATGFFKRALGEELALRYMPALSFFYDDSFDYGERIERLLQSIKTDDGKNHKPLEE